MPGIKELKTRIKSIGSTRKITRAMQMVSAAKMRRAQQAALNSRTYSELAWELISNLTGNTSGVIPTDPSAAEGSGGIPSTLDNQSLRDSSARMHSLGMTDAENPLLKSYPQGKKVGYIIISTNTGLVGGFNSNLLAKFNQMEKDPSAAPPRQDSGAALGVTNNSAADDKLIAELFVMGRKAKDFAVRFGKNMMADFAKSDATQKIEAIYPLAKMASDLYKTGEYKAIYIIYNKFISTLVQKATVKQLLPFEGGASAKYTVDSKQATDVPTEHSVLSTEYLFEPTPELVLNHLIPRIIESQIYQALLESDAGEHSARMVTMKNATEAAGDLISDLTLTYNQLRQGKITTELAEITAGRIALE